MGGHPVKTHDRWVLQRDRVSMSIEPLRNGRHAVEVERRLEPELRTCDPAEPAIRDHDVRPSSAAAFCVAPHRDVFAPSNREDLLVGVEVTANRDIARLQKVTEGGHLAREAALA
jgi:hypothetical protein